MSRYLVCSSPIHGHVGPMSAIGAELVARGHAVTMLTGSRFEELVRRLGMDFAPLAGAADFDDRDTASYLPDADKHRGISRAQYDIQTIFVSPIGDQARAVEQLLARLEPDAVLVDGAFAGVSPMLLRGRDGRPPILAIGVTPLSQSSRDLAPYGMGMPPARNALDRARYRLLGTAARRVIFRRTQRSAERIFAELGEPPLRHFVMDLSSAFDRFLQLGPRELEYPRCDLAPNTTFVGSLPGSADGAELPGWWGDLDGRRVVHVTQGTIDNDDFGRLIRPTLDALADLDLLVVVSTGGRPFDRDVAVPENARVARYLPYGELLPRTDVFITNGGFGGVQQALAFGVPIVVAGDTEDKPEVAARIGWSGAGIDLRTGTPTSADLRAAVQRVLDDPAFRGRARALADANRRYAPYDLIAQELDTAVAARS